jgi:hypothetical protein
MASLSFSTSQPPANGTLDDLREVILEMGLIKVLLKQLFRDETREEAQHAFVRLALHGQLHVSAVNAHC